MTSAAVRTWKGEAAVVLAAGDYEAVFLPELGMLGASITHRGGELLSLHGGVGAYREGHTTGLPLLAPWANRLARKQFKTADVDVDLRRVPLHLDGNRLPIHGTMTAQPGWEIARVEPGRLTARFVYAGEELLRAFPFPHELTVEARLNERGLNVTTTLRPTGRRRVPVSFGWHPYFRVPGPRRSWTLGLPARAWLELDSKGIPTGRAVPLRSECAPLGDRTFDNLFALGRSRRFSLDGRGRRVEVRFGRGYEFAQIYAPPGRPFVAIEPMTAPTNALVTGACPVVRRGERFAATFSVAAGETSASRHGQ